MLGYQTVAGARSVAELLAATFRPTTREPIKRGQLIEDAAKRNAIINLLLAYRAHFSRQSLPFAALKFAGPLTRAELSRAQHRPTFDLIDPDIEIDVLRDQGFPIRCLKVKRYNRALCREEERIAFEMENDNVE
jgi:hypothetical protein